MRRTIATPAARGAKPLCAALAVIVAEPSCADELFCHSRETARVGFCFLKSKDLMQRVPALECLGGCAMRHVMSRI